MADILPYLGVEKKREEGTEISLEDYTGLTQSEAESKLKKSGLSANFSGEGEAVTGQLPAPGQILPADSSVLLYLGQQPEAETVTVPDFLGMNRAQAEETAGKLGLYILSAGNPGLLPSVTVTSQSVPKDTQVPVGTTITLTFTDLMAKD